MTNERSTVLNERAQYLLKVLVEKYISEGQPVGSRTLSKDASLNLSPATIRNVMSDLEDAGLVISPHTSAGRIPTAKGYRLFVDSLVTVSPLDSGVVHQLRDQLDIREDTPGLVESASALLSDLTHMAGVVTVPRRNLSSLTRMEFIQLSENRILVVIVVNEKEVQNRVVVTDRHYTKSQLEQAANYLNAHFTGKSMSEAREALIAEMKHAQTSMNTMMHAAVEIAEKALQEQDDDYVLAGQTNLIGLTDLNDMAELRSLFEAFSEKHDILNLLDHCLSADGVQIYIGEESGYRPLDHCSVVTAPYSVDGQMVGVLGVIGPTRMDYERVISLVDVTAKLMGAALNQQN